jgi:large subunit ribosomal protein L9
LRATTNNLSYFEREKAQLEAANLDRRADAQTVGEKVAGLFVAIIRNAGDSGQLYGSVNSRDIAEAVCEAGFTIAREQVLMDHPIKALGLHTQRVRLHPEVIVEITVNVAQSDEEAAAQERTGQVIVATENDDDDDDGFAIRSATFKGAAAAEGSDRDEAPAAAPAPSNDDSKEEPAS